jgi:hypothetical protein
MMVMMITMIVMITAATARNGAALHPVQNFNVE